MIILINKPCEWTAFMKNEFVNMRSQKNGPLYLRGCDKLGLFKTLNPLSLISFSLIIRHLKFLLSVCQVNGEV